jgi:F0F1-type ATP synthase assembly protein I
MLLVVSGAAMTVTRESRRRFTGLVEGESIAWSVMSTLAAGPVLYGFIGWGMDQWLGTARVFTALGIVLGFVLSFYIVYVRYGRENSAPHEQGAGTEHADGDGPRR